MTTRDGKLRSATIDEIKAAALSQVAASGAPSLSLRGVAREIGMSPAGLYRYYDGGDALLTDLITDAYSDLAEALEGAIEGSHGAPPEVVAEASCAHRAWPWSFPTGPSRSSDSDSEVRGTCG